MRRATRKKQKKERDKSRRRIRGRFGRGHGEKPCRTTIHLETALNRAKSLPLPILRNRNATGRVSISNVYDLSVWNERQIRKPSSPRPRIGAKNRHRRLSSLYRSRPPLRLPLRSQIGSFVSKSFVRCFDPEPL